MSTAAMIVDPSFSFTCMSTLIFVDKQITSARPLLVANKKSPMQCFMRCKLNNECWYFDYVMTSGQCRLYDVKAGDSKADDQPGCLVYAVVRGQTSIAVLLFDFALDVLQIVFISNVLALRLFIEVSYSNFLLCFITLHYLKADIICNQYTTNKVNKQYRHGNKFINYQINQPKP